MPATKPACVCIRDLAKNYGRVEALRGLSLQVERGEIFGLLGPNGAGKTTALDCILGLRRPDAGSVTILGIDALSDPTAARGVCGALIQGASLQDRLTPRQALQLFASFYANALGVDELLRRVGLVQSADVPFASLSAGQKQRLFLAMAYVNDPQVVILDEPSAGLDPQARRELRGSVRAMKDEGRTIIISTHDLDEAQQLCDRIAIIDRGKVVAEGTPGELIARCPAPSVVWIVTSPKMQGSPLASLNSVKNCRQESEGWWLGTSDAGATTVALVELVRHAGAEILELRIDKPTLEDTFLAVTGRPWEGAGP